MAGHRKLQETASCDQLSFLRHHRTFIVRKASLMIDDQTADTSVLKKEAGSAVERGASDIKAAATPEPTLLTIILNYKTAEMTLQSAETALAAMEGIAGEIVIVDNDSQDGSFETMSTQVAARG